jgi:hypothetical protein
MSEAELNRISLTFILLATLSVHHFYFGKDIPKWSWYLSVFFSIASGMYIGFVMAVFPTNLIIGGLVSLTVYLSNLVVRKFRDKKETYSFKDE